MLKFFKKSIRVILFLALFFKGLTSFSQTISIATNDIGSGRFTWVGMMYMGDDFYSTGALYTNSNTAQMIDNIARYTSRVNSGNVLLLNVSTNSIGISALKTRLENLGYTVTLSSSPSSFNTISSLQSFSMVMIGHTGMGAWSALNDNGFCNALVGYFNGGGSVVATGWINYTTDYNSTYKSALQTISPFSTIGSYGFYNPYNLLYVTPTHPILNNVPYVSVSGEYGNYPVNSTLRSSAVVIATYTTYSANGASSNSPVCSGSDLNLSAFGGNTYAWTGPNGYTSSLQNPTITGTTSANAGTYTCVITTAQNTTVTKTVTVDISAASVGGTASSDQVIATNTSPSNITLTGSTGTIQWQVSTDNITFTDINGATSATLTSAQMGSLSADRYYRAKVTSGACSATYSNVVTVTVTTNTPPTISALADQTVCNGNATASLDITVGDAETAAASLTLTGSSSNTSLIPNSNIVFGGTGANRTVTVTPIAGQSGTATITLTVTDGLSMSTTTTFVVTVKATPTVNDVSNQSLCNGASTSAVTFGGAVNGTVYNWTNDNTATGLAASGTGNIASFTATNNTAAAITSTVTVTPALYTYPGSPTAISSPVTLNYADRYITYTGVSLNGGGNSAQVTPGSSVTLSYNYSVSFTPGYCPGCVVQFYVGMGGTTQTLTCESGIYNGSSGTKTATFTAPATPGIYYLTQSGTLDYVCQPQSYNNLPANAIGYIQVGTACTGTPKTFTYTVAPTPTVNTVADQSVCNGAATTAVTFGGAVTGTAYTWTNNNTATGLAASGTGNIASFTATNNTAAAITSTVTVTPTVYTYPGAPTAITSPVTLNYADRYITYTGVSLNGGGNSAQVTPGSSVSLSYNYSVAFNYSTGYCPGCVVQFYVGVGGTTQTLTCQSGIGGGSAGSKSATFTAPATPGIYYLTQSGTLDYVCQPQSYNNLPANAIGYIQVGTACTGTPKTFTYTVNPTPTVNAISNQTVCNGAATTAVTFAGTNVSSYSWTNNTTSIGLAASGTGAGIPSFTAVNTGSTPITATVSVTATSNNVANLNYTIYSTHGGNGNTSQYPINPATLTELNALFNTANNNTVVSSTGTASANTLFNWTIYTTLTAAGISIPNSGDYFAVKATGTFTPAETGTYSFAVDGDDAIDLAIDGTVITSYYGGHGFGGWRYGSVDLVAGNSYSFVVRMQEGGGGEGLKVVWKRPSQSSYSLQPSEFGTSCTSAVRTFTITVNPNVVTTVPNQVIASGNATTAITFSGAGAGATYNWTNDNTNVIPVSGGSGNIASFVTTNTGTAPQVATFSVTATATNGGVTCTGPASTFTITVNPVATMVQPSNYTYANATTTSAIAFSSLNTGGTTTYAWTNSNTAIGLAASGSGNVPSFTATNAGTAPISATITVTPTYTNGGVSAAGSAYTFTITINPTAQVNAVSNQTVCNGAATTAVTFGTVNTGGTTTYAWTNNTTSVGLAASGSGNIASFTATNTGTAPVTATITVTPSYTNAGLTTAGTAITFTITVNPTATVNAVSNQTVCNGAATTAVTFGSPVSGATYAWTNSNTAIGLAASGTGNLASFTGTNATTAPITGTITVTPTANGCVGTASTFTITVNPTATVNAISNQTVCNGASTTAVTFAGPVAGTTYAWSNNTTSIGLAASGAGNIAAFTATNTGTTVVTATITVTPTANSCVGTPSTFTIAVNPTPTVASVANQTVCNNASTTAVNFTGAVTGTTYSWTNNTTSIGLAASGTGNIAAFTATNVTTAPITATITVTPSFGGCAGSPTSFTITVNPTATVNTIANQVLCNGSNTAAVTFAGPVAGTTYAWTNTTTGIGLAASGSGTGIASFATTNATTAPLVGTITITPTANGCVGTPRTFTITVNPIPTVSAVASQVLCHGSTTGAVTFAGAVTGTVYSWTNSAPSIGLAASGTGNIASFTATNTGSSPVIATITVTPSFTNGGVTCTGAPTTFTITVNPLPVVSAGTLPSRICISDTLVALSGTPTGGYWSGIGVHGFNFLPATAAIGSFTLTYRYTDANNCTNSSNITATVLECAERNRTLGAGAVSLYPNPNNGSFNLKVNSSLFNNLSMRVYNASGNLVSTKQWTGLVYGRLINVNLTNLPTGIYVVRLYYGDGIDAGAETAYRVIIGH